MRPFLKFLLISLIVSIILGIIEKWYNVFYLGRYWEHSSILGTCITGFILPLTIIYLAVFGIQRIVNYKNQ